DCFFCLSHKRLLISELDDQRDLSIALHVSLNSDYVEHDRIAGFQPAQYSREIRERAHRNTIDAIDDVAFDQHWLTGVIAKLRDETVRIDVLDVKTLDARQVSIGEQLRRQLRERDAEMQCVATRVVAFRLGCARWSNPFARA